MGRIAEALKRAQQERAAYAQQKSGAPASSDAQRSDGAFAPVGEQVAAAAAPLAAAGLAGTDSTPGEQPIVEPPQVISPFTIPARPIVPDDVDPQVVALHDATSAIAEKYRSARTRLLTGGGGAVRAFAVTSSAPGEGKTVTAANLAFSLAELRHLRVTLVDLDLRNRGLSTLLGAYHQPGMAEVLRGTSTLAEVCLPLVRGNLFLLPAGDRQDASPSELLSGSRAGAVFREINDRFHYSLIDTPPISTAADIGLIAPLCHSVLIVVRMNRTPEPLLRRSVKMLQANHVPITGCILAGYTESNLLAEPYYEEAAT